MNSHFNSEKYANINRDSFFRSVNQFQKGMKRSTIVVPPKLLSLLDNMFTFTELKQSTCVENIVKIDTDTLDTLRRLGNETNVIFLVDTRVDINIDQAFKDLIGDLKLEEVNLINLTYSHQMNKQNVGDYMLLLFTARISLIEWALFPVAVLDPKVFDCRLITNSEGLNLYFPTTTNFKSATRRILLDNLANILLSLIEAENITITKSVALGENSIELVNMLKQRLRINENSESKFIRESKYGKRKCGKRNDLIVFERSIDTITPMMTDLTYSGLLNELEESPSFSKGDDIWDDLKYLNFGAIGSKLNSMAKDLQEKYDSRHEANTISEIKDFVDGLGNLQSRQNLLKMHTTRSSDLMELLKEMNFKDTIDFEQEVYSDYLEYRTIIDHITEAMCSGGNSSVVLRLCSLFSQACNGLRDRDYNLIRQELVDTYGNDMIFKLETLSEYGLFTRKTGRNSHQTIVKTFDTIPDVDIDPSKPKDMNYAYSGVVPLIPRILQAMYDRSIFIKNNSTILHSFVHSNIPTLSKLESVFQDLQIPIEEKDWVTKDGKIIGDTHDSPDPTFVVVIGGVTHGELSAFDYLNDKLHEMGIKKEFVVVTDGIINGNFLI